MYISVCCFPDPVLSTGKQANSFAQSPSNEVTDYLTRQ